MDATSEIATCLKFGSQRSFFLSAGAGSGKTRALVTAVEQAIRINAPTMAITGARIGVITYTRAARDEIRRRLKYDNRVAVSTIHSFAWGMIKAHTPAVKIIRERMLVDENTRLTEELAKARTESAASLERRRKIERNLRRLEQLPTIVAFGYSPERDVPGRDELSHHDVITICSELLTSRPMLGQILVSKFPILFVDEVQDTSKSILPELLRTEAIHRGQFTLGLFGDTMQRIYLDGVVDLAGLIPVEWARPRILQNHRSASRIVQLANAIRSRVDEEMQTPTRAEKGNVRIFLVDSLEDRDSVEVEVRARMSAISGDLGWMHRQNDQKTKTLTLEHSLAATRLGFREFTSCFQDVRDEVFGQGAASSAIVTLVGQLVALLCAIDEGRLREADQMLGRFRTDSHRHETFDETTRRRALGSSAIRGAARGLVALVKNSRDLSILGLLEYVQDSGLFALPESARELLIYHQAASRTGAVQDDLQDDRLEAWVRGLGLDWVQVGNYQKYITGNSSVDTQQGVKGLEFQRVMVVLDDAGAKGNTFSFDKLLETRALSKTDIKNAQEGKDTTVDRTRRLLYVSCTRARESLAIVYYVDSPELAIHNSAVQALFHSDEIEVLANMTSAHDGT